MLGIPYSTEIDMWSFGCIICELFTGIPIFPGESEAEQMACIIELKGTPPRSLIEQSPRYSIFFDEDLSPRLVTNSRGKKRLPATKELAQVLKCNDPVFLDFIERCLEWDPLKRMTPDEALKHEWIFEVLKKAKKSFNEQ